MLSEYRLNTTIMWLLLLLCYLYYKLVNVFCYSLLSFLLFLSMYQYDINDISWCNIWISKGPVVTIILVYIFNTFQLWWLEMCVHVFEHNHNSIIIAVYTKREYMYMRIPSCEPNDPLAFLYALAFPLWTDVDIPILKCYIHTILCIIFWSRVWLCLTVTPRQ